MVCGNYIIKYFVDNVVFFTKGLLIRNKVGLCSLLSIFRRNHWCYTCHCFLPLVISEIFLSSASSVIITLFHSLYGVSFCIPLFSFILCFCIPSSVHSFDHSTHSFLCIVIYFKHPQIHSNNNNDQLYRRFLLIYMYDFGYFLFFLFFLFFLLVFCLHSFFLLFFGLIDAWSFLYSFTFLSFDWLLLFSSSSLVLVLFDRDIPRCHVHWWWQWWGCRNCCMVVVLS